MTETRRARIMIIDDALANIEILLEALEPEFDMQFAASGEEALSLLKTGEHPDLILLDVMMPGMDGFEVCRLIKNDEQTSHIPIIFVTAKNSAHDETLGLEAGAVDYITKPFPLAIVKARIRNHLKLIMQEDRLIQEIRAHRNAREQLQVAGLVYSASSEAMALTDAANRILAVNPAFTTLTGYAFEEVKQQNPKMLGSGRHDAAFYQHMWHDLNTTGKWQGEIWNRRKDGEEYAARLVINSIYDDSGALRQRVALFSDITEQKRFVSMIQFQANYDELTQLPNRRLFLERLERSVKKAQRENQPVSLLYINLDCFKEINDTLGHYRGDTLLILAAQRIRACVSDIDTVARIGGDEFTVILEKVTSDIQLQRVAQAILDSLASPFQLEKDEVYASASIGITRYPDDAASVDNLLKNADQAMFAAKRAGRNGYRRFSPEMHEVTMQRMRLNKDLRHALERTQLSLYYQPIVELVSGNIHKAEALLRWQHPEFGFISPADFIPIAEDSGLLHQLGEWVFKQAVQQTRHWQTRAGKHFQISVNMSPVQFRSNGRDIRLWMQYLHNQELAGDSICIEITEGLLMDTDAITADKLFIFRDNGIQVAIDDFGTGYSSLAYLKEFDIDYLKIDRSFVSNLEPDSNDFMLAEAIVAMAHKLGLRVIAEGVETEQQRRLLERVGCDYGQGYLFSRPVPAHEFEQILQEAVFRTDKAAQG
jgi:diguanylate cyclase (GGDEF)-like protein/PAS domain S-box-containing protein